MDNIFGIRLKKLRISKELSQTDLAKILNVSQRIISNWEKGEAQPTIKTINKIAIFFDVPPTFILGHDTETKRKYNELAQQIKIDISKETNVDYNSYQFLLKHKAKIKNELEELINKAIKAKNFFIYINESENYFDRLKEIENQIQKLIFKNMSNILLDIEPKEQYNINDLISIYENQKSYIETEIENINNNSLNFEQTFAGDLDKANKRIRTTNKMKDKTINKIDKTINKIKSKKD